MPEERQLMRGISNLELDALVAECLGLPLIWSSDPYYPPQHPGRMPYLHGPHPQRPQTYEWTPCPRWSEGEQLAPLLDELHGRGYSWAASGVPLVSSAQMGTIVLLKQGLRPPKSHEEADGRGIGLTFPLALARAIVDTFRPDPPEVPQAGAEG